MRILMISDHADPLADIGSKEAGGQNIYVYNLARFLAREGIFVDIFTRWDRKNKKEVVKRNHHLRIFRVKAGPKKYFPRDDFLNILPEFTNNIQKKIEKENIKYDLVHTNYWYSGIAGLELIKKLQIPLIHVYHSIGKIRLETLRNFIFQENELDFYEKRILSEKEIAKNSSAVISTSPVEKTLIDKAFGLNGRQNIKVIPIGVNLDIFKPLDRNSCRKKIKQDMDSDIILYVGRLEWRKGIGTLLYSMKDVLKKFPKAKLLIIGGGKTKSEKDIEATELERQQKIINELGLGESVEYLGPISQKELPQYYGAADLCVVPSYYEPFGIVPLESMACGTPVVASKTGGLKYTVLPGKTGELSAVRDYDDLANKIIQVLGKGKAFYSKNCVKRTRQLFSWQNIAKSYVSFFEELRRPDEDSNVSTF